MTQPLLDGFEATRIAPSRDYDIVRRAIRFLHEQAPAQPELEALAGHLRLSPDYTQKLFTRWCGLSPKEFLQAITIDRARQMLAQSANILETAQEVGLSGGSRLHDLFVTHEAVTPGDVKRRGAGLVLRYGYHETPFGTALACMTDRGLAALAFADEERQVGKEAVLAEMLERWPLAVWIEDADASASSVAAIFARQGSGTPIRIVMIGTDWELRVWQALLTVPIGMAVSYSGIARSVCTQRASRAVGTAVGKNPLAFVVPCHRVLRSDGGLGGYHWNVTRKQAILGWEAGHIAAQAGAAT
jgi:AraC family transcriptional regulator, regulatory protein of adaptative response / methylated-DNA-[protein]-cysteine methyltransferase